MTTTTDPGRLTVHNIEQRSQEWHELRHGMVTASAVWADELTDTNDRSK